MLYYTYNLTSQDTLIKGTDTTFTDMNIEFEVLSSRGEDIWRANSLRPGTTLGPTVDFKIETEGQRTYVRLNDQYPFKADDTLIFSHIIPQELIDAGAGGTPEEQNVASQVASLQATVASLQRDVATNTNDIDTLENTTQAGDVTFYHGILFLTGGRTAGNRASAKSVTHLTPLATAELNNPTERTEKTISSLILARGLVQYNAGATVGYYSPWVAIETVNIGTGTLYVEGPGGDESDLWRPAGSVTLNTKAYHYMFVPHQLLTGRVLRLCLGFWSRYFFRYSCSSKV